MTSLSRPRLWSRRLMAGLVVASLLSPSISWAAPPTASPTPDQMAEARRRYDRALELSDEGNYDDALVELQRAYAIAPTYRLLYNLGVVSSAVHDYVKAIEFFNEYLAQGGAEIDAARVAEVQSQLQRLSNRIAKIRINVSLPNADISVDDVAVGRSPMETPLTVNTGRHRVNASVPGYFPATAIVELAGNDTKVVSLTLVKVTSNAPEKPSHPIPWLGWGITAALAAGTVVTGILALNQEKNYDNTVGTLGASGSDISSSYEKMRILSVTSDILLVGTVVAAGVSFYLTIKPVKTPKPTTGIRITGPGSFVF